MSRLRQEDLRALEQSRQRLYQLTQSIGSLKNDILRTSPMPQWDSVQISAQIIGQNLKSITEHLSTHSELFERTVVYPSTNFPGRTQENLLGQLLRKKLEPGVETWVEEGMVLHSGSEAGLDDLDELWKFARDSIVPAIVEAARTHRRENYTVEEREMGIENVSTGLLVPPKLRRALDDDESGSEEEDEDADMEDVAVHADNPTVLEKAPSGAVRSKDDIMRFMMTGLEPEDDPLQQQLSADATRR